MPPKPFPRQGFPPEDPTRALRSLGIRTKADLSAARGGLDVDVMGMIAVRGFQRVKRIGEAVEKLIGPDERRREYLRRADAVARAYKALLPDERAAPFLKAVAAHHVIADAIRNRLGPADISKVSAEIEQLLDENIEGVSITAPIRAPQDTEGLVDLSSIDFEKLGSLFARQPKTTVETMKNKAQQRARAMAARNPTRVHLVDKLEKLVDAYNAGTLDADRFFEALKKLVAEMDEEERRAAREELTEDELAIFDLLTRPEPKLTKAQEIAVKKVARELLQKLPAHLNVLQWRTRQQTRAAVLSEIRVTLNELPEEPYPQALWDQKVDRVWQFVFNRYPGPAAGAALH
jgi:type I restriction enzyme, R subunit